MLYWPPKDTDEVIDYTLDWTRRLNDDTIVNSSWALDVAAGSLLMDAYPPDFTPTSTRLWLSQGDTGTVYVLTNTVDTAGGRVFQQSVTITIRDR